MLQAIFGDKRIFYGYFVVAAGSFALFVSMGARNGLGVYIEPMEADRIWDTRTAISMVIGLGTLVNALTQPFLGALYDKYGGRIVISASLLVLGLSTLVLSVVGSYGPEFSIPISINLIFFSYHLFDLTNSLLFLFIIYSLIMSTASSGVSLVTVHAMLSKWFYRKRGIMLSVATAGTSFGGLLLTPFAGFLILAANWRIAWIAMGIFVLLLALPLALIIMRDEPSEVGELPDGDESEEERAARLARGGPRSDVGGDFVPGRVASINRQRAARPYEPETPLQTSNWKDALRSAPFWQLSGAYFVCGVTTIIISAHYVPFAIDLGIHPGVAALAFGYMQGLNAVGVIVVGFLSDRFSRKNLLGTIYFIRFLAYVMLVVPGFAMMLWGFAIPPSIGIWGFATLAGLSWIATPPLTSSLTADIYGVRNIGTLNGLSTMSHQIGGSLSVVLAGILYDATGAYEFPFAIAGMFLLGATLASYAVNERRFSIRYQPPRPTTAAAGEAD